MANELNQTVSFKYSKNGIELARQIGTSVTVNDDYFIHNIQSVGSIAEEALSLGEMTYADTGYVLIKNLDSVLDEYLAPNTNFITIGRLVSATYAPFIKLKPGETALFRLDNTSAPYAKADSATIKLEYWIISD